MSTYTYPSSNIHSWRAVYDSAVNRGVDDAIITLNGTLVISADIDQETADAIVADSSKGSLFAEKQARIKEVLNRTQALLSEGFGYTRPSDSSIEGPFTLDHEMRHRLRNLKDDIADSLISMPQAMEDMDGGLSVFNTAADVTAAYQALIERGVYLVNAGVNSDSSKGEALLISEIDNAVDTTELNAIVDTRASLA